MGLEWGGANQSNNYQVLVADPVTGNLRHASGASEGNVDVLQPRLSAALDREDLLWCLKTLREQLKGCPDKREVYPGREIHARSTTLGASPAQVVIFVNNLGSDSVPFPLHLDAPTHQISDGLGVLSQGPSRYWH